jgi:hypothetical protein
MERLDAAMTYRRVAKRSFHVVVADAHFGQVASPNSRRHSLEAHGAFIHRLAAGPARYTGSAVTPQVKLEHWFEIALVRRL